MVEIQKCTDKEQWDDYILENGGHPLQVWGWGQVKAGHGWKADRYFAYADKTDEDASDVIIGAAQVLTRHLPYPLRAFSYIPRGPVGFDGPDIVGERADFLDTLAGAMKRDYHSIALSVEPQTVEFEPPEGWQKGSHSVLPAQTIALDLTLPESQLLANMAKKTRQYIRKSAAEGISIRQVRTLAELNHVLAIYHQTAHRAGFQIHSDSYYHDVFNLMADNGIVYASYLDDQPIAFLWLAISADTAFELYGGMNEQGSDLRANYALKWHAIRKTKEWGLNTYDFGGLISGGVSVFKQGWAEDETYLAGTFDKQLSPLYKAWSKGLPAAKKVVRTFKRH